MQTNAFNAHDVETLLGQCTPRARFVKDGCLVAEGGRELRNAWNDEMEGCVARLRRVGDETVIVEYSGDEGRGEAKGVLRFACIGDRICECRADHDPDAVSRYA